MQGFITKIQKVKDEDLIVTILSQNKMITSYRFYGSRHSVINLGYKIDFELEHSHKSTIPQLRNILHLNYDWQYNREKMQIWQIFISLFHNHLKDIDNMDEFYFNLLENCTQKWEKQNPKRLSIESYILLLEFEGRLHKEKICFLCEENITENMWLARSFLPAHAKCLNTNGTDPQILLTLFNEKKTIFLDDNIIEKLWNVLIEGL